MSDSPTKCTFDAFMSTYAPPSPPNMHEMLANTISFLYSAGLVNEKGLVRPSDSSGTSGSNLTLLARSTQELKDRQYKAHISKLVSAIWTAVSASPGGRRQTRSAYVAGPLLLSSPNTRTVSYEVNGALEYLPGTLPCSSVEVKAATTGGKGKTKVAERKEMQGSVIALPLYFTSGMDAESTAQKVAMEIMLDDPNRTWAYAITIENYTVRLDFFSRIHGVQSETFSIVEEVETFIKVFLTFICAPGQELGYDPALKRDIPDLAALSVGVPLRRGAPTRKFELLKPVWEPRTKPLPGGYQALEDMRKLGESLKNKTDAEVLEMPQFKGMDGLTLQMVRTTLSSGGYRKQFEDWQSEEV